ncbi:hypothetical protein KIM372_04420 [Bombiscardovia nodaiensis]|uniref:Uncharacterized protein n=1 Tax=Bombiscardovia nodaiensis TaxID=2932181 RepID=A0ABN6SCJ6_9BIFI|nr:hypothetical protein KIM372_04420 [Bombiscardovia nodaiensis]
MGKTSSSGGFPWKRDSKQPSYQSPFDQDDQISFDSADDSSLELEPESKPGGASQLSNPTERWSQTNRAETDSCTAPHAPAGKGQEGPSDDSYNSHKSVEDDEGNKEDTEEEYDEGNEPSYAYPGSPITILLERREKAKLTHLLACTIALVLLADVIFALVKVQQPRWLFGTLSTNGIVAFQHHPNLLVFGIYALSLALSTVSFFLAVHITWRSKPHGSTLRSCAVWTRRFCAVSALACAITMGFAGPAFFNQLGQRTLPLLPTNSRVLGSEYKSVEGWLAEGSHERDFKAAFEAPNNRIIASLKADGLSLSVYLSAPDSSYEELEPVLEQVSQRAIREMSAYGISYCQVSVEGNTKDGKPIPDLTVAKDQIMPSNQA